MEGFKSLPYLDQGGIWTNGYGNIKNVSKDSGPISEEIGEKLLRQELSRICPVLTAAICDKVSISLTPSQFTALADFAYNEGLEALLKSDLRLRILNGDMNGAAKEFDKWIYFHKLDSGGNRVPVVSEGLVNRRAAEKALFLSGIPQVG